MSEEEIIENTKNILKRWQKILDIEDDIERDIEMNCYSEEMPFQELRGILDLYNKEKEKNKRFKNELNIILKEYISKDKIREFIKNELPDDEIMQCCENYDSNGIYLRKKLQELLEE